jgi:nucleoside-diphosphate-sugar epimerase
MTNIKDLQNTYTTSACRSFGGYLNTVSDSHSANYHQRYFNETKSLTINPQIHKPTNPQPQSINMTTINKGDIVLVTGVSGYIGSHVAEELIAAGYKVRGTSRTASKVQYLVDHLNKKFGPGKIEIVEVPDMIKDDAYDAAVAGVSGVVHLASVLTFGTDPKEVVDPSVKGTLNIFNSATREPKVKSFVCTSSSTACMLPIPDTKIKITKDTFNEKAIEAAYKPNPTPFEVYAASKTIAEKALWDAVKKTSPAFQVSTVLPNGNFGHLFKPDDNSTGSWIIDLYNGKDYAFDYPPQWFVDVRDDAKLHVAALVDPACNGQRIFAYAQPYTWNDVLAVFRKLEPGKSFLADQEKGRDLSEVPNAEAEELLKKHYGHGWTSFEESIRQNLRFVMV